MKLKHINVKYVLAVLSASVGSGFQHGYHLGVINIAHGTIMEWIKENKKERYKKTPSDMEIMVMWSVVIYIFSVGGIIGSAMTACFAKRFGHKGGLLWNNCIMFVAAIFLSCAETAKLFEIFILGRFLSGIHAGLNSGLCPIYLAEIAPLALRGTTTALYFFVLTVSFFLSVIFSMEQILGNKEYWSYVFGLAAVPVLIQSIVLYRCPESPRFLLLTLNDEARTREALIWFRNTEDIVHEMELLKEHKIILQKLPKPSFKAMFTKSLYRSPLIIALTMVACQQICGMPSLFTYSTTFMEKLKFRSWYNNTSDTIIGMTMTIVIVTFLCVVLIDIIGRRRLFLGSLCGLSIDSIFLLILIELSKNEIVREYTIYVIVSAILLLAAWYAIGVATIPLVLTVELFNHFTRPLAVSVVIPFSWFLGSVVTLLYLFITDYLGFYILVVWIVMDLIIFIFIHMYLPETKGKSSKHITKLFYTYDTEDEEKLDDESGINLLNVES